MPAYLARKLASVALLLFVTSIVAFLLPRLAPGDTAIRLAGPEATTEQVEAIRRDLGLNQPVPEQYLDWLGGVLTGDLGTSLISGRPVAELITSRLGSTVELTIAATVFMVVLGVTLGVLAAGARKRVTGAALDGFVSVLVAAPPHVTGLVLILAAGAGALALPVSGEVSVLEDPLTGLSYLVLPALALALPQAAVLARLIQARMQQVRREEFVELAVAKGVPPRRITMHHVLRNSVGTALMATGIRIGELLSGAVVIEAIFARNGIGQLAISGVRAHDYLVVQVIILGAVAVAALVYLLSELGMAALDPRIRLAAS